MTQKIICIRKGDDMHCHLRRGEILGKVVGFTRDCFSRAVIMPNTNPPILTANDVRQYRNEIKMYCNSLFEPLMTIQLTEATTPAMIAEAKEAGAVAAKLYPRGVTTNSESGVSDFKKIHPALAEMQRLNMLLLVHGESPDPEIFCLDREATFLHTLSDIVGGFPKLKIVLEHITTEKAFVWILSMPRHVAATITVHHLLLTLDDVVGGFISPHNFCKPIAKRPEDRRALLEAATSGSTKFFYGGDSAPHLKEKKECSHGCAGVFKAPVALCLLAQIFETNLALHKLEDFVATFGAEFYGLPYNTETIALQRKKWVVPDEYEGIVPFMAGEELRWQVV